MGRDTGSCNSASWARSPFTRCWISASVSGTGMTAHPVINRRSPTPHPIIHLVEMLTVLATHTSTWFQQIAQSHSEHPIHFILRFSILGAPDFRNQRTHLPASRIPFLCFGFFILHVEYSKFFRAPSPSAQEQPSTTHPKRS